MLRLLDADLRAFRIFDVADEIRLEDCRALIEKGGTATRRMKLGREGSEFIQVSNPPLLVQLGPRQLALAGGPTREVQLAARVFDFGCISVSVTVRVERGSTVEALVPLTDQLSDDPAVEALALDEVNKLRRVLEPACEGPHLWEQSEGYTVVLARDIEGAPDGEAVLADPNLARLLVGEVKESRLSAAEVREALSERYQYTPKDLAVIEWNAAFFYEPTGSEDLVELLEFANAQLLELRYYDHVLDAELERVYDTIGQKRGGTLLYSPYRRVLRELTLTLIELSEFIERIENSLKIVGDVYLARVFEAAGRQLRVGRWTEQVTRKHRLLQQTYGLLKGEVDTDRSLTLEVMVVALILLEILMALLRVAH
jgi:hypothetical protein